MCSRWYTPDFHVLTIAMQVFIFPQHWGLYHVVKEIGVTRLQVVGDTCLHITNNWKLPASQISQRVQKKMEITGHDTRAKGWSNTPSYTTINIPKSGCQNTPTNCHIFGPHKKHLADKWFASDANVKQAVSSFLQTLDMNFFYAGIQALVAQQEKCLMSLITVAVSCGPPANHVPCIQCSQSKALSITVPVFHFLNLSCTLSSDTSSVSQQFSQSCRASWYY
jgi:hypothetical protein